MHLCHPNSELNSSDVRLFLTGKDYSFFQYCLEDYSTNISVLDVWQHWFLPYIGQDPCTMGFDYVFRMTIETLQLIEVIMRGAPECSSSRKFWSCPFNSPEDFGGWSKLLKSCHPLMVCVCAGNLPSPGNVYTCWRVRDKCTEPRLKFSSPSRTIDVENSDLSTKRTCLWENSVSGNETGYI